MRLPGKDALLRRLDAAAPASAHALCRSLTFQVGKDCTPLRLVPLPCNCIAHLPEANMLLNIKNYLAAHCDIHTNLDRAEFDKPDAVGQVWTVEGMKTVSSPFESEGTLLSSSGWRCLILHVVQLSLLPPVVLAAWSPFHLQRCSSIHKC